MLQVLRLLPRTLIKSSTSLVSFRFFTAALFSFTLTQHLQANSIPVSLYSNSLNSSSIHNMSATKSKSSKLIDTAHIQPPKGDHKYTIIWLHGLGDSSDGFADLFAEYAPSNTRVVLPNAPVRPITVNGGARMQGWYD